MRSKDSKVFLKSKVAEEITRMVNKTDKAQHEIATDCGLTKSNIITMFKQGRTKLPLNLVVPLSKSCGTDPAKLMKIALKEYQPGILDALSEAFDTVVDDDEAKLLQTIRRARVAALEKAKAKASKKAKTDLEKRQSSLIAVGCDLSPEKIKAFRDFVTDNILIIQADS